jgi:MOSC domain-containing protein YiiM
MNEAKVVEIYTGAIEGGPVEVRSSVTAVAGAGLEGDRYFQDDVPPEERDPTREITLVPIEGIRAASADAGIDITPADLRRNIVTEGVDLKPLIGKTFWVGEVQVEGLKDNPPCAHLQRLAGKPLLKPMVNRAGIRGRIVSGGTIKPGDEIRLGDS